MRIVDGKTQLGHCSNMYPLCRSCCIPYLKEAGLTLLPLRTRLWWKIVRNWSEHWKVLAMVYSRKKLVAGCLVRFDFCRVRLKPEVLSIEELVFGIARLAGAYRSDLIPRIFLCRTVYFPIVFFFFWFGRLQDPCFSIRSIKNQNQNQAKWILRFLL